MDSGGLRWKLDGFTSSGGHSPYTLLVGVTLEDAHGNTGQLAVFPGSHVILNHTVRNLVRTATCLCRKGIHVHSTGFMSSFYDVIFSDAERLVHGAGWLLRPQRAEKTRPLRSRSVRPRAGPWCACYRLDYSHLCSYSCVPFSCHMTSVVAVKGGRCRNSNGKAGPPRGSKFWRGRTNNGDESCNYLYCIPFP